MDPQRLMIAHGEKVVVAAVALFVGWSIYSSFTDASIRPQGVNQQDIQVGIDNIMKVMNSNEVPTLKPPKAYLQDMKVRFAQDIPRPTRMSWLMAHPDISGGPGGTYFYVFELNQPTIEAKDNIGKLMVTIRPPSTTVQGNAAGEPRRSATDFQLTRMSERGPITNTARVLGIQIESKVGQDEYHPLNEGGISNGFVTLEQLHKLGGVLNYVSPATWQTVYFRVRTVLDATGFTGDNPDAEETVLVHAGPMDKEPDWIQMEEEIRRDPDQLLSNFLAYDDEHMPPGVTLTRGHHLYFSDWTDPPVPVIVTANVRFAFERVNGDPANPGNDVGIFWVSKQYQTQDGNQWLPKPEEFKVPLGQGVGGWKDHWTPRVAKGDKEHDDMSTPFVLERVDRDQIRTWFWEVKAVTPEAADPGGAPPAGTTTKDKVLVVLASPKEHKIDVAVLKNTKTGDIMLLPKLELLKRPTEPKGVFVPLQQTKVYDEKDEFAKSPVGFEQRVMTPTKPVMLDPADAKGPLALLRQSGLAIASVANTKTKYAQLSDGRLVWWDNLNEKLRQYPEPEIKDEVAQTIQPHSAPHKHLTVPQKHVKPPSYQPTGGGQPGTGGPPGGMPPGAGSAGPGGQIGPPAGMPGGGGGPPGGASGGGYTH